VMRELPHVQQLRHPGSRRQPGRLTTSYVKSFKTVDLWRR
jgi:hypothetical protein